MYATHLLHTPHLAPPTWRLSPHRRRVVGVILTIALILGLLLALAPRTAYGAELRQGDAVVVAPGETIDDDLYAVGQSVTIQGIVNGDVLVAGQTVTISGSVAGDVMAAGGSVVLSGPVAGTARLAGQTVDVLAPVGQDVLVGAAALTTGPRAEIGRDVLVGGGAVTLGGPIGRSVRAGTDQLTIAAPVGGDVLAQASSLRLASGAGIGGSLTYTSGQEAVLEPGATVGGLTTHLAAPVEPSQPSPGEQVGAGVLGWLRTLVGFTAYGLLLVLLFPRLTARSTETLAHSPLESLGLGFAVLAGAPVAALLLFIVGLLVGGWWIGPLAVALYLALLPLGYAVVGLYVGHVVLHRLGRDRLAIGWHLLAGLAVLGLVSLIPVAGGLLVLAALIFGLGAFVIALAALYRAPAPATGEPVALLRPAGLAAGPDSGGV